MKPVIRLLLLATSIAVLGNPTLAAKAADSSSDCAKLSDNHLTAEEVVSLVRKCAQDAPAAESQNVTTARVDTWHGDSVDDLPDLVPPAALNVPAVNAPVADAPIANTPVANTPVAAVPNPS